MQTVKNILIATALLLLGCLLSIVLIFPLLSRYSSGIGNNSSVSADSDNLLIDKTTEVKSYIDRYFVGEYDEKTLADAAAEAIVKATGDRWSYYLPAEDYSAYQEQMLNAYVGVGMTIQLTSDEEIEVTDVTRDGPAYEAGILAGDFLTAVNGSSIKGMSTTEIRDLVRGEEGTSVQLTLSRDGESYTVDLVRRIIETQVASYEMLDSDVAYISIKNFDTNAASHTITCVMQAINDGAKALVFDVRFNPGGYKTELVEILDYLLPEGPLFRMKDYSGKETVDYSDSSCVELPIAVLINEDSYSAAEFFAAAIQEYEAGTIVGAQTCGKGYFQYSYILSDGSVLSLSSGTYYTPNDVSLIGTGVIPDIPVAISDEEYVGVYYGTLTHEEDSQLQAAIEAVTALISETALDSK